MTRALGAVGMIAATIIALTGALSTSCTALTSAGATSDVTLSMTMQRVASGTLNPFTVTISVQKSGTPVSGLTPTVSVPSGSMGAIVDHRDGTYSFTVTPSATGVYPVTATVENQSISRKAIVLDSVGTGVGQPMAVPGAYVNTDGYDDGAVITPDGQFLFIQYGPFYMSGLLFGAGSICAVPTSTLTSGYDVANCSGRTDSSLVFDRKGPNSAPYRPGFPSGAFDSVGKLLHIPGFQIAGVYNGLFGWPTLFYGFKRQADGTFAEPFKVAFNDARAINAPYGLSFLPNTDGTSTFVVAWDNNLNDIAGDQLPKVYSGQLTLGQNYNLGDVTYSGDAFASITPYITPVSFGTMTGVQGNPHVYATSSGTIDSIWTDDERTTHDLTAWRRSSGSLTTGTFSKITLPSPINTVANKESQPFFTGSALILRRDYQTSGSTTTTLIAQHAYQPTNGSCASGYSSTNCWGTEQTILEVRPHLGVGEIYTIGEPTVATISGRKYLYFVYLHRRTNSAVSLPDFDADVGYVEIP